MEYTSRQLAVFTMIEALGFLKDSALRVAIDPDFIEITVRGEHSSEELTYKLNMRTEGSY